MGNVWGSVESLGDALEFKHGLVSLGVSSSEPADSTRCVLLVAEPGMERICEFVDVELWNSLELQEDCEMN